MIGNYLSSHQTDEHTSNGPQPKYCQRFVTESEISITGQ